MATTNEEAATTGMNEFETPPKPKRVNSNRNLIWTFRSVYTLSILLTVGAIPISLFTPDVEAKLGFSPIMLTIYFYYVFLFNHSFTHGLSRHKRLYRDATPEEILAIIKVAAEKRQGFINSNVWEKKCLFVEKIQDQRWTREQRTQKTFYIGGLFFGVPMLGVGYFCLLLDGFGETVLKVVLGRISLKDGRLSLLEVVATSISVTIILTLLVPYLWAANHAGWNWGILNLVSMVREDMEKDMAQCLLEGDDSDRLNWWIHHIGDIERVYFDFDEEQKICLEKGMC